MHEELFELVEQLLMFNDEEYLADCILACHNGRLQGPINSENLHLFRRYRNTVSGDPMRLINEAIAE